jgi:putative DNA primase/helicase
MITLTGNNLTPINDMGRRTMKASLDARLESPETRTFENDDPVERVLRDRSRYVTAGLTVLLAYQCAGRPEQAAPVGSFEDWSRMVRDPLIWLGEPDPWDTTKQTKEQDPKRKALAAVLHQWQAVLGDGEVTAKHAVETAIAQHSDGSGFVYAEFRDALMAVAGDKGAFINTTRFGHWLGRNKGRVIDQLRIEPGVMGAHGGVARWKVVKVVVKI